MRPGWQHRLDDTIARRMAEPAWRDPLDLRVSVPNEPPFLRRYSTATSDGRGSEPPIDEVPFRIASVTKVFVAAAVLRLEEEGRLDRSGAVEALLPAAFVAELKRGDFEPAAITIDHLLHHTSGIGDHSISEAYLSALRETPRRRWTPLAQLQMAVQHTAASGRPGERFHYSDTGYVLLGQIVEVVIGKALHSAVRELLALDAIGLRSTWWDTSELPPMPIRPLADQRLDDLPVGGFDPSFDLYGGGGLISTLRDLDGFCRALFERDEGGVFRCSDTLGGLFAAPSVDCGMLGLHHAGLSFRTTLQGVDVWAHTGHWGVLSAWIPAARLVVTSTFNRSRKDGFYDCDALLSDVVSACLAAEGR